jgi:hypothetical protein
MSDPREQFFWTSQQCRVMLLRRETSVLSGESLTLTQRRCPYCDGKNVAAQRIYTIQCSASRTMDHCSCCARAFSATSHTPLSVAKYSANEGATSWPIFPISVPITVYHEGSYVVIYIGSIRTRLLHNVTSQSYIGVKTLSPPPLLQCMEPNAGFW